MLTVQLLDMKTEKSEYSSLFFTVSDHFAPSFTLSLAFSLVHSSIFSALRLVRYSRTYTNCVQFSSGHRIVISLNNNNKNSGQQLWLLFGADVCIAISENCLMQLPFVGLLSCPICHIFCSLILLVCRLFRFFVGVGSGVSLISFLFSATSSTEYWKRATCWLFYIECEYFEAFSVFAREFMAFNEISGQTWQSRLVLLVHFKYIIL